MAAVLEVRNVAAAYGDVQALWDVSFDVDEGHIATLLGSNGAGKTTTLRVISGLLPALEGEVVLRGRRISGLAPHAIVDLGVIQVPEGRHLWPNMTVEDNLLLGAYGQRARGVRAASLRTVYALFPRLAERAQNRANKLSGGEQQMLAIGRALMSNPELLLMDEPTEGLAPLLVREVGRVIAELKRAGLSILLVEQNLPMAVAVADRVHVLNRGQIVYSGGPAALLADEDVKSRYLGVASTT